MKKHVYFFLPTRKGSQRVKAKNTRPFSDINGGLLELKLRQVIECKLVTKIILSTNDEESIEIAKKIDPYQKKITVVIRPDYLCLDTTLLTDLIAYVPEIIEHDHILWGHVTTPFVTAPDYDQAIELYFEKLSESFDSLISVSLIQNFLLDRHSKFINVEADANAWPRTQDLPVLYEINHAIFLTSRQIYLENKNRVGVKPYLMIQDKIKSFDIDWEDDFKIAEAIYEKLYRL